MENNKYNPNHPEEWPSNKCFICGKKINLKERINTPTTKDKKNICVKDATKLFDQSAIKKQWGGLALKYKYSNQIFNMYSKDIYIKLNKTEKAKENENKGILCCPLCGSTNLQITNANNKSFSIGKAIVGTALVGGIGALAGLNGNKSEIAMIVCMDCGLQFKQ